MKGFLKSLEAIIAVLIIAATYIFLFTGQQALPQFDTTNWKLLVLNELISLDAQNNLRTDIVANNTASIQNKLSLKISQPLNYLAIVCDVNCSQPTLPTTRIASVKYLISGDYNNATNKELVVFVWFGEAP